MAKKIFVDSGKIRQSAYFGWQDKELCLYGLKEGYKNSADDLLSIALEKGDNKTLDTYIFPVLFSYRHCIEISLKQIYMRCLGKLPRGGHNLLTLWDNVKCEVIDGFINSASAIEQVKKYKTDFVPYSLDGIDLCEIREMLKELQGIDSKADVWRYLISTNNELYFTDSHFVDYTALREGIDYIYSVFDFIQHIVDEYLCS